MRPGAGPNKLKASGSKPKFRLFVLGAGFSVSAGLPLANDLWRLVLERAGALAGRAGKLWRDLDGFVEFKQRCFGQNLTREAVNFEEFLGFLEIEHQLGLLGSDTWSDQGNETQIVAKVLISRIIAERMPPPADIPDAHMSFVRQLRSGDIILTFNYDTLLEDALDRIGVPYRLFPTRYSKIYAGELGGVVDTSREEVVIIKLHGSIDWFDKTSFLDREKILRAASGSVPKDIVFGAESEHESTCLVDGPRFSADPLKNIYRVKDARRLYQQLRPFETTPSIILPSTSKILSARQFREFFWGLGHAGAMNLSMAIIGYSLPPADEYARQILYGLVDNYQRSNWDVRLLGRKKTRLQLIDFRTNSEGQKSYRSAYSFVSWERAAVRFDGFNERNVEAIFSSERVGGAKVSRVSKAKVPKRRRR